MSAARVTAVVLSMGEPTVERALASVAAQTRPVADVVLVEGVSPFHRALNEGASRVTTEHFIQVDADMVLERDCVERLSACLDASVGAVIGMLRDPLYGRVEAIKLLRTDGFDRGGFPDSISPDTDFLSGLAERGLTMVYALRHDRGAPIEWHTFGEHRPEYTPLYTFEKQKRDGRRLRYRGKPESVPYHLDVLNRSTHPVALLAEIALAHGLFLEWEGDRQRPAEEGDDFRFLEAFLGGPSESPAHASPPLVLFLAATPEAAFRRSYERGARHASSGCRDRFAADLDALHRWRHPWAWIMQAALCRGLFAGRVAGASLAEDWERIAPLARTPRAPEILMNAVRGLRARVRAATGR